MRFRFRLQRMLQFVELREKAKKLEVASLMHAIQAAEVKKDLMEAVALQILNQSKVKMETTLAWLPYETDKVSHNLRETQRLEKTIHEERERLAIKQEELGRLSLRRKALESLREKRRADFRIEESRKDQRRLDEVYSLSRLRGRN